jgi:hypothetical protein
MSEQNLDELLGPAGRSDYSVGDTIKFREGASVLSGEIIHISAPGQTVTGKHTPTTYWVDAGCGFPSVVYSSDIIVEA